MNGHSPIQQEGLSISQSQSQSQLQLQQQSITQGKLIRSKGHKQSMAELKLRRLTEHNLRLRDDLARPRLRVSEASLSLLKFCTNTKDPMLPSIWGSSAKSSDPFAPPEKGCCILM
ncbi:uncharacterized protein I206_106997 [Kwoniella pini CBS 10737]|uniref:Guanine nucleotide-binding protein subunit gamma n=1 Tax=Kwoniella pini CBS 10737 TaxID=1296096 RepID=A0A1B9HZJ6_9TREE|nr:guanine nucleotide-binding protein subunit gamma [Kwoniella pini CBS 10737]OCF48680.1 guanine nucleotide-binding protein subunit gamma [Kwoniella pini CBS 10737]